MERQTVTSSQIKSIGYGKVESIDTLEVEFNNGAVYQYANVDKDIYDTLLNASSVGRAFNAHVRGAYDYVRVS